ncbi:phosphate ABC transporter substrate-binding protein PstS [Dokdonella sp.]|uniref:phosphate ABC transporter substrate-binding protein PstS n=1 Tax=Dokdonella sp. TaxID=2291710 RepID=UPI0039C88737
MSIRLSAAVIAIASSIGISTAQASDVTGAGSSFVFPLMSKWSADYNAATGNRINYQSIGSSGGIAQIKASTVDFGASDKPLDSNEVNEAGLVQFPLVIGGVVPVVNVAGIEPGKLKLSGSLLADIFLGKITHWNDPAIRSINEELPLPDGKITIVHRSDGSGTTFNFTNYLSKVNPQWKSKVGEGTSVQWPVGLGGKGNEGVSAYVKQIKNSIGYVELSYALQNTMSFTRLENAAGNYVVPSAESFAAAATSADWKNAGDFSLVITNAPGDESWPISATVFVLMHAQPKDAERARAAREFFSWGYANGKSQAASLDYVPLPESLVTQIEAYWADRIK